MTPVATPYPLRRVVLLGLAAALVALMLPVEHADARLACRGDAKTPRVISISVDGKKASGFYVAPKRRPQGLAIFSHGNSASPTDWFGVMRHVARRDRVVGVAMYYPGEPILEGGTETRGWFVREGAEAGIAAAQAFLGSCRYLAEKTIVDYGVSMGGNTSGLMAAAGAKRPGGDPLFDYWFAIEGATNVIETYLEATAVAPANETGRKVKAEIEHEAGGSLAERPGAYRGLAVISHAEEIAASGIKGVVLVHGVSDGLVPYNQSVEMQARLLQVGLPTDFYTVATKPRGTNSGTTIDGYLPVEHESPFAGHGGEDDKTHLVIRTGLKALDALFQRRAAPVGHRKFFVDGNVGTIPARPSDDPAPGFGDPL